MVSICTWKEGWNECAEEEERSGRMERMKGRGIVQDTSDDAHNAYSNVYKRI